MSSVFTTKINLINDKVYQLTGDTLSLSGNTNIRKLQYLEDDSANYNNRSVIDKGYLDYRFNNFTGSSSILVSGATNGLTLNNKNVELGGNLIKNTDIDINNYNFRLGELSSFGAYFYINSSLVELSNYYNGVNNSKILMYFTGTTKSTLKLQSTTSGNTAGYIINQNGLQALNNYYSNNINNPRWIPDKQYIDSLTGNTVLLVNKTYTQLYNMLTGGTLTKGQYYRITDFKTIYQLQNTSEILSGNTEPLILYALETNKISNLVKSEKYPNDIIEYDIYDNSCEDGTWDQSLQRYTGGTFRKGKITYRKDTNINLSTYYDWRNVKFRRWAVNATLWNVSSAYNKNNVSKSPIDGNLYVAKFNVTGGTDPSINSNWKLWLNITTNTQYWSWTSVTNNFDIGGILTNNLIINNSIPNVDYKDFYTFTLIDDLTNSSGIITGGTSGGTIGLGYRNIEIGKLNKDYIEYYYDLTDLHNNIIFYLFLLVSGSEFNIINVKINNNSLWNTINADYFFNNNIDSDFIKNCIVGNKFNNNTINKKFQRNITYNEFNDNNINILFDSNIISNIFQSNFINNNFNHNKISNNFYDNEINDYFYNNIIDINFYNNNLNFEFQNNLIGANFNNNVVGNSFDTNIITDYFNNNEIGNKFYSNIIGDNFYYNTVGNFFNNNTINSFNNNTIGNYFYNNNIYDFYYNTVGNNFYNNILTGTSFVYNFITNNFYNNKIGNNFYRNEIGIEFNHNIIGNGFFYNKIDNNFYNNIIVNDSFQQNSIGNNFQENNINNSFQQNSIGNNFQENILNKNFDNSNINNTFYSNITNKEVSYNIIIVTGNTTLFGSELKLLINHTTGITITLNSTPINNTTFKIKDISGNAFTYNIIIDGNGKNIDGNSTTSINTNYGAVELMFNDTTNSWYSTGFVN